MNEEENSFITIRGRVVKTLWDKNNSYGYGVSPTKETEKLVELNKYQSITVKTFGTPLSYGIEYNLVLEEQEKNKYGVSYQLVDCFMDLPTDRDDVIEFLTLCTSYTNAVNLVNKYPNILQKIQDDEPIDVSDIKGIKDKTLEKIVNKVKAQSKVAPLYAKYGKYGLTLTMCNKLLEKHTMVAIENLMETTPYAFLTSVKGIGFVMADKIVLSMNRSLIDSADRLLGAIRYILEKNEEEGHTFLTLDLLYSQCISLVAETIHHFPQVVNDEKSFYSDTKRIALLNTYNKEMFVRDKMLEIEKYAEPLIIDTKKYHTVNGITLTQQQATLLDNVCQHGVSILVGFAGSGKSQTIASLIQMLDDNHLDYILATPTAKSADVLADYTHKDASTIHRAISCVEDFKNENEIGSNSYLEKDVIILDEFSMCDLGLFCRLIGHVAKGTRLVLVGDSSQLPSIGCGNLLQDFVASKKFATVFLDKIFRYADGGLMKVVTDVRNGKTFLDVNNITTRVFGNDQDLCFVESIDKENAIVKALTFYKKLLSTGKTIEEINVISPKRVGDTGTIRLNQCIQELLLEMNLIDANSSIVLSDDLVLHKGDKVKQTKNDYNATKYDKEYLEKLKQFRDTVPYDDDLAPRQLGQGEVYNGQTGIVTRVTEKYVDVEIKNETYRYSKKDAKEYLDLGYALSIHSSQGMSIPYVICLMVSSDVFMLNNNLIYTALTRTKERCYLIGNTVAINRAIHKRVNLKRNTMLQELFTLIE